MRPLILVFGGAPLKRDFSGLASPVTTRMTFQFSLRSSLGQDKVPDYQPADY